MIIDSTYSSFKVELSVGGELIDIQMIEHCNASCAGLTMVKGNQNVVAYVLTEGNDIEAVNGAEKRLHTVLEKGFKPSPFANLSQSRGLHLN